MSEIKVNKISPRSGTDVQVGDSGDTVSVAGNIVKTNALQASDGGNIVNQCGTTITIGASGDTVSLASGASQSGFGRSGSVDWQTTTKTSTFTAANGEGYFINSGSAITMNLPAGSAGAIVAVSDYARNFATYNFTISPNGSEKIGGVAASLLLTVNGQSTTLVYVDGTKGWVNIQNAEDTQTGNPFLIASGGTESTSGNCKIHKFTGPGTFTVASASTNCAAENVVSYFVLAGGGGGGGLGGGGGAGGFRELKSPLTPYTASPKCGYSTPGNRITVTAQAYPITVGGGGSGQGYNSASPASGTASIFSCITSAAGGGGGSGNNFQDGENGGSGGGGNGGYAGNGGSGNTPPVTPPQGFGGGTGALYPGPGYQAGGGGGANASGGAASSPGGGDGGSGTTTQIVDSTSRAGGGGGGSGNPANNGGCASDGAGDGKGNGVNGDDASANRGGGGGGQGGSGTGGNGGSGIVVIRYKYQ